MGLMRRSKPKQRTRKPLSEMSSDELAQVNAESDLETMLAAAVLGGSENYNALSPDGRELDERERAMALDQLTTGAIAIVTAERGRELVERMPQPHPIAEMLTLLRVMQQGLVLALSEDLELRARALDAPTAMMYLQLARQPWQAVIEARETGVR